jgi:alpha-mannosidase
VVSPPLVRASGLPVALGTLKKAEDDGALVLRLYEPRGARGAAVIEVEGLARAERVSLLEDDPRLPPVEGGAVRLELRPFEVVTLKLHFRPQDANGAGGTS